MRTSIDLAKNDTPVTAVPNSDDKRNQNLIRNQKMTEIIDNLTQNIATVVKHPNTDHSIANLVNNNGIHQSIGKWMYERDDFLQEVPIDLSLTQTDSTTETDDDVVFLDSFSAGPSGLNAVHKHKNSKDLIKDCDLNPTLDVNPSPELQKVIEEVVFDINVEEFDKLVTEQMTANSAVNETITIDDNSIESTDSTVILGQSLSTAADDVEIIRVKYLNEPIDSDIEVLSEILSPREVIDVMRTNLKSAQNLTQLSFTTIRLIMSKYQWNRDLFVNDFFEFGVERLLNHYNLVISYELKTNGNKRRRIRRNSLKTSTQSNNNSADSEPTDDSATPHELKTCLVCFDEYNLSEIFAANCGHTLCIECWNQYLSAHVSDSSSQDMITCPGDNCPNIVDDDDLLAIIADQKTRDKYQRLISNSFVQKNQLLKWCPNGDCLHAVRVKENGFQDVECICKTVFCFLCGNRWHEPLSCQQHEDWIQRYASSTVDKKSAKWLTKHTKCCPKCRFPIEKNGGCNYVLCLKCRHQFCYHCLGRCSHGRCLGQNAPDALQAQANDQWLKDDLQVYPTIKDQYQKQSHRFAIEDKLHKDVSKKLETFVKCPEFKSALKFLKSAFTVLCHCRQTVMYSYVFGYYLLGPTDQKMVYNQNLIDLEQQTEYLSNVLTFKTTVILKEAVLELKRHVQPIYRECETKRSKLVRHIRQGLANNHWQFSALSN